MALQVTFHFLLYNTFVSNTHTHLQQVCMRNPQLDITLVLRSPEILIQAQDKEKILDTFVCVLRPKSTHKPRAHTHTFLRRIVT